MFVIISHLQTISCAVCVTAAAIIANVSVIDPKRYSVWRAVFANAKVGVDALIDPKRYSVWRAVFANAKVGVDALIDPKIKKFAFRVFLQLFSDFKYNLTKKQSFYKFV